MSSMAGFAAVLARVKEVVPMRALSVGGPLAMPHIKLVAEVTGVESRGGSLQV